MPATTGPTLNTRPPTKVVGWPLILLEGAEKAGKSLAPVVLTRSPRVGMAYWIDLGEGAADEYAALPGSDFLVVEHDGSYRVIVEQLTAVWNEADRAARAGEPPVVVVVDSMSALWTMLVNWTNDRARRSKNGRAKLAADPDAEVDPTSNLWNDANKRHKRVMDLLMTFPGIAVVTARGKEVAVMGANGQPVEGRKEWKVEGQKALAYDSTAWVRMHRDPREAQLIGVKSLRVQVPDRGVFRLPTTQVGSWEVLDLDAFVFDVLGCGDGSSARSVQSLRADDVDMDVVLAQVDGAATAPALQDVWNAWKDQVAGNLRDELLSAVNDRLAVIRSGESAPAGEPNLAEHAPNGTETDADRLARAAAEKAAEDAAADADMAEKAVRVDDGPTDAEREAFGIADDADDRCAEKVGRGRCTKPYVPGGRFCEQHTAERGGEA